MGVAVCTGLRLMLKKSENGQPKRQLNVEMDRLEIKIKELSILFEQHFLELLPFAPDKEHKELKAMIRQLMSAPFHNSQTRFRLRQVVQRYQTYNTYWTRVLKQKEDGTYSKDKFKAEVREKANLDDQLKDSKKSLAENGIQQLYNSYEQALKRTGANTGGMDFDDFKKKLVKRAKDLKKKHGSKKIHYKVVVKNGKAVIKASTRD
ncbi:MAG: hypothetical protein KDD66_03015 [Bdellovibrionales bacterium]|nr:hypothetical protein [Bdellovibrionales bacterium]